MGYQAALNELFEYVGPRDKGAVKIAAQSLDINARELSDILNEKTIMPDHIAIKIGFSVHTYYQNQYPNA